jgi:hypothetical protein
MNNRSYAILMTQGYMDEYRFYRHNNIVSDVIGDSYGFVDILDNRCIFTLDECKSLISILIVEYPNAWFKINEVYLVTEVRYILK